MVGRPRPTVVVSEDEPEIRELLVLVLERADLRVVAVGDGREVLEALEGGLLPDLLLLDLHTPRLDAVGVMAGLEARGGSPCPVLVMSGGAGALEAFPAGVVQGFVSKPFDVGRLIGQIAQLLGRARP